MQPDYTDYQKAILENAVTLAAELQNLGLRLVSGGTDNHLVLVDISTTGVTGKEAEEALEASGIIINRNAIPFDTRPPRVTSGIRLGTPAVTTCGFGREEMKQIATLIVRVISNIHDQNILNQVRDEVARMSQRFPVPGVDG